MDLNDLTNTIARETMMGGKECRNAFKWLSKQNDLIIFEVLKLKKNQFYMLKAEERINDPIVIEMIAFYGSIKEIMAQTKVPNRKNQTGTLGSLKKIGIVRAQQLRKPRKKVKFEKLLDYQGVVIDLIDNQGYSYRSVKNYLRIYHKFIVSHTKIGEFYNTIKAGRR